jgi:hypothetical protein
MKNSDENEEENEANNEKDDSQNDDNDSVPPILEIPPFIMDVVKDIERQVGRGFHFESVNVRVVGEDDLDTLPNEVLQQILDRAVEEERFELAVKVRDAINNKKDGE